MHMYIDTYPSQKMWFLLVFIWQSTHPVLTHHLLVAIWIGFHMKKPLTNLWPKDLESGGFSPTSAVPTIPGEVAASWELERGKAWVEGPGVWGRNPGTVYRFTLGVTFGITLLNPYVHHPSWIEMCHLSIQQVSGGPLLKGFLQGFSCWFLLISVAILHSQILEWICGYFSGRMDSLDLVWYGHRIHPWRLTWNIVMEVWKIMFLSRWVICRFHVILPGCIEPLYPWDFDFTIQNSQKKDMPGSLFFDRDHGNLSQTWQFSLIDSGWNILLIDFGKSNVSEANHMVGDWWYVLGGFINIRSEHFSINSVANWWLRMVVYYLWAYTLPES